MSLSPEAFARLVDHTLLKPESTESQIRAVAREGLEMGTASVCVNSYWVPEVVNLLRDSDVKVCSVVGFPLGSMNRNGIQAETDTAMCDGAEEIDMVIPLGLVKSSNYHGVADYVRSVRVASSGAILKVILETALLTDDEIVQASSVVESEGADFVKTSTGFNIAGGASVRAVQLIRGAVGPGVGIKAAGGIRALRDVQELIDAGATRLGLSSTLAIYQQLSMSS